MERSLTTTAQRQIRQRQIRHGILFKIFVKYTDPAKKRSHPKKEILTSIAVSSTLASQTLDQ